MDGVSEAGDVVRRDVVWEIDDAVEFFLVFGCIPEDAVVAVNGEIEGVDCLPKESGTAIRWEEVKVFVDVVGGGGRDSVTVRGFRAENLGWDVDN